MASRKPDLSLLLQERLDLAIEAIKTSQVSNIRVASQLYNVPYATLYYRLQGWPTHRDAQVSNHKLTTTEEKTLLERIKTLDNNSYSPTLPLVRDMANLLLRKRLPTESVGVNWLRRWAGRHDDLIAKYLRKYDYQRAKYEDPEILTKWFNLVDIIIKRYGIITNDIFNFDETGFQMGVITTAKIFI
jgi:hypothetical protein